MMTFTDSTDRAKHWYMSSGESWSSSRARSTLFTWSTGLTRSEMAWRSTVSVCTQTPSIVSTTTSAPSVMRSAAVTSEEKSTWPGESMRLMRYESSVIAGAPSSVAGFSTSDSPPPVTLSARPSAAAISAFSPADILYSKNMEMPVDLIVMPRSASSARVSVYRVSPACFCAMMPALATRESVSVDLPWSTWAMTDMDRMLNLRSMRSRSCSVVKFTIVALLAGGGGNDCYEMGESAC
mmetsp:Transcript_19713/g.68342  ORF Transcript_19713/g.68342 Transcript_19713/m.68342 type:complete len:238 (-) Transcript_19713:45-758(-)